MGFINKKQNILLYTLIIIILFSSEDCMISFHYHKVMYVNLMLALGVVGLSLFSKKHVDRKKIMSLFILFFFIIASMIFNLDFSGLSMFVILAIAFCLTEIFDSNSFYNAFENIIFFITLLALALFVVKFITGISFGIIDEIFYLEINPALPWGYRLYGVFREPAMYCIYIGLALGKVVYFDKSNKWLKLITYGLSLVLTGSITGYIAVVFLLVISYFILPHSTSWRLGCLILVITAFIFMFIKYNGFFIYLIKRFATTGSSSHSSNSRYYSVLIGGLIGLLNPIFGAGAVKSQRLFEEIVLKMTGISLCWANMITYLFASFGFCYIVVMLYGLYGFFSVKSKKIGMTFIITICLLLCGETMTYSSIIYIFMFYGYGIRGKS